MKGWCRTKDLKNKSDNFLSFAGTLYVILNSRKDKEKALKENIVKDILPRDFNARIEEIQEKHRQATSRPR